MDEVDERLIEMLTYNAQQRSEEMANKLNISASSVRRRVNRLISKNIIRIVAVPIPGEIGLPLRAVIAFDVMHDKLNSVLEILGKRPEVRWLSATSGRYDIIAIVWFPSTDQLFNFIESEVGKIEGVKNVETFICLQKVVSFY